MLQFLFGFLHLHQALAIFNMNRFAVAGLVVSRNKLFSLLAHSSDVLVTCSSMGTLS